MLKKSSLYNRNCVGEQREFRDEGSEAEALLYSPASHGMCVNVYRLCLCVFAQGVVIIRQNQN